MPDRVVVGVERARVVFSGVKKAPSIITAGSAS
jgi:hypothetical protein